MGAKLARRLVAALVGVVAAAAWYHWSWPPVSFSYDLWMLAGVLVAPVVVALVLSAPGWKPREIAVSVFLLHAAALITALRLRWDDTNFGYDVGRELVAAAPRCRPIEVAGAVVAFHGALVAAALALRWNDGGFGYDGGREGVVIDWGLYALCAALITGAAGAGLAWAIRWLDHQHQLDQGR